MLAQEGDRVVAVSHTRNGIAYVFGYGQYLGEKKPSQYEQKPIGFLVDTLPGLKAGDSQVVNDSGSRKSLPYLVSASQITARRTTAWLSPINPHS